MQELAQQYSDYCEMTKSELLYRDVESMILQSETRMQRNPF